MSLLIRSSNYFDKCALANLSRVSKNIQPMEKSNKISSYYQVLNGKNIFSKQDVISNRSSKEVNIANHITTNRYLLWKAIVNKMSDDFLQGIYHEYSFIDSKWTCLLNFPDK